MTAREYATGPRQPRWRDTVAEVLGLARQRHFCAYCMGWSRRRVTVREHEDHLDEHRRPWWEDRE